MTPQSFADHAAMFGVHDAALAMLIEGEHDVDVTLAVMRSAMRGMRIAFYPQAEVFQWLPVPAWAA